MAVEGSGAALTMAPFATVPRADRRTLEDEGEGERLVRYVEAAASRHAVRWVAPG